MPERKVSPTGARTMLGIGLQPDAESAVIAKHLVEYRTGTFEGEQTVLYGEANIDTPSPRLKAVVGDFSASGSFTAEVTPRRAMPMLLTALLGTPSETILSPNTPAAPTAVVNGATGSTTRKYYIVARNAGGYPSIPSPALTVVNTNATISGVNSVAVSWTAVSGATGYDILRSEGAGTTIADALRVGSVTGATTFTDTGVLTDAYSYTATPVSRKTWKHTWDRKWLTVIQKKGDAIFAFPFVALRQLSLRVERGQREVITSSFTANASNMVVFADPATSDGARATAMTTTGLTTALYDSLPPFSPAKAIVKIADAGGTLVAGAAIKGWSFQLDRNTSDEYCLNGKLGPRGFIDGTSGLDCSFDAYFRSGSEAELKRFMGNASTISSGSAYGFQGEIKLVSVSCVFPYPSGLGFDSELEVVVPRAAYGSVGLPVGGRNEPLMQNVRVEPIYDGTAGTDVYINIVSNETAASIADTSGSALSIPSSAIQ